MRRAELHTIDARPRLVRESRTFWVVVLILCGIAAAASIRRLVLLAEPFALDGSPMSDLDALFLAKAALTRAHVIVGLALAAAIPAQLWWRIRARAPRLHRWLGRAVVLAGLTVGLTGIALLIRPIGGPLEIAAIVCYGALLIVCLAIGWRRIRQGDVAHHREWMLRAVSILLGIATTRPVVGFFFATRAATGLSPHQFFGIAFWIGFTSTALAGEWYIRRMRASHPG